MINCIDCEWVFDCPHSEVNKKTCNEFYNAHRKIVKLENVDYEKMAKEMLE